MTRGNHPKVLFKTTYYRNGHSCITRIPFILADDTATDRFLGLQELLFDDNRRFRVRVVRNVVQVV